MTGAGSPEPLVLAQTQCGLRYLLGGRTLSGGDTIAMCFSGGWVIGRFEWTTEPDERPRFHCSIELEAGRVAPCAVEIPEGALVRLA